MEDTVQNRRALVTHHSHQALAWRFAPVIFLTVLLLVSVVWYMVSKKWIFARKKEEEDKLNQCLSKEDQALVERSFDLWMGVSVFALITLLGGSLYFVFHHTTQANKHQSKL